MADVRAGVAYVDVRLGSIEKLKSDMTREIEGIGEQVGKKLGDKISKSVPKEPIENLGKNLSGALSKAFLKDAGSNMQAGFRAIATGQLGTAKSLFAAAGRDLGSALKGGFDNIKDKIVRGLDAISAGAAKVGSAVSSGITKGWAKFQEFGKMLDSAAQKMGFLSFQIQNFGIIASAVFTAPTVAALGFATAIGIKTAAEIESATSALKFLLPAGTDVEGLLKRLQKIAIESPIFDTADLVQYAQVFTSAGVEISKTERFLKAFSNIALVTGTNTEKANLAVRAITQAFGKGKLQAEELNQQLGEAMPAVMKLLRDELGVTQVELNKMVKEGKISGDDLIAAFTRIGESSKFLEGAAHGARTLNGVWQNFKESLQTQLGMIFLKNAEGIKNGLDKLAPSISKLVTMAAPLFIKLIAGFQKFADIVANLITWYQQLTPQQQAWVDKLAALAVIIGPVVLGLGAFMGALAGIAAGIAAIATPVGGVILAIVAIGAAIAAGIVWFKKMLAENSKFAEAVKRIFSDLKTTVWEPLKAAFMELWTSIKAAFAQIKNALMQSNSDFGSWWDFLKGMFLFGLATVKAFIAALVPIITGVITALGSIIEAVASLISGIMKILKGLIDFLRGVFTGDWQRAWDGIKEIWDGLWDAIIGTLFNLGKAIVQLVGGIIMGIVNYFKSLYNTLVGHSIVPDMVNAIIMWFNKLVSGARAIWNALGAIFSAFYGRFIAPLVSRISSGVSSIVNLFQSLANRVISAISGLGSRMYSVGVNIIQGLINGIQAMAGTLFSIASNIASTVVDKVSSIFDIGSPSKVFYQIGEWNMMGLADGMSENQPSMKSVGDMIPTATHDWGGPSSPLFDGGGSSAALEIQNYYANDNVDPWRQSEDWYFLVTARGGVA